MPANVDMDNGRSGMDLWKILVLGKIRLCCNWDYDKLRWFTTEILDSINRIVVGARHRVLGLTLKTSLHSRCDSFVVETEVHFPTDVNLLRDAAHDSINI